MMTNPSMFDVKDIRKKHSDSAGTVFSTSRHVGYPERHHLLAK